MPIRALARFFVSQKGKKTLLILGGMFFVGTFFIALDPSPFLRFGYVGVFLFNLVGPGSLLVPVLAREMNVVLLALASASGMVLNDSISWVVGRSGDVVIPRSGRVEKIEHSLHRYGPIALFFWSLAPIPYDFVGLITGYLEFPYRRVIIPMFMGKFLRFLILGFVTLSIAGKRT